MENTMHAKFAIAASLLAIDDLYRALIEGNQ